MKLITDLENIEEISKFQINHFHGKVPSNGRSGQENGQTIEVRPNSPNLLIEIINSTVEPKGIRLVITPLGLKNSQRKANDGMTYFGYQTGLENQETIDYLIKPKDDNCDDRFLGLHFYIRFEQSTQRYVIKDLCNGFGTFIKITGDVLIRHNDLLNIGEDYLVFTIGVEDEVLMSENYTNREEDSSKAILNIKIFSSNINHGVLSFPPEKKRITIGRSSECDVIIEDSMLSRIHCTVLYKANGWYIMDGSLAFLDDNKRSTNGTWIYPLEETEIKDKMTFKSNHNLFTCSYSYNANNEGA